MAITETFDYIANRDDKTVSQEDNQSECSTNSVEEVDHTLPLPAYPRWWTVAEFGDFRVRALIDSGASRTCLGPIGLQIATHLGIEVIPFMGANVTGPNGQSLAITAQAKMSLTVATKTKEVVLYIADSFDYDCVLGANWFVTFYAMVNPRTHELYFDNVKVCQVEFDNQATKPQSISAIGLQDTTAEEKAELEKIVARTLPDLGPDAPLGCTDWAEHEIEVACEKPIKQRCYPVSQRMEEIMYGQLENMLKQGTVTPSTSSWSSPIVMMKKANGEYRFCVDYRKLNAVTKISARPMPHMDSILRKLRAAKYCKVHIDKLFNTIYDTLYRP
ncbi:hypothetical protein TKK_0017637 [Trichogramma kaykai]